MSEGGTTAWHRIGRQLQSPSGFGGRIIGWIMGLVNERPNAIAVDALALGPGDHVLELGFGPGRAIRRMASFAPAGKFYGVDRSDVMLAEAQRRNRAAIRQGRVVLHQGAFDRLPLPDDSIHKVLAVNVIYFWRDIPAILQEIHRVLRPGGRVSIYATDAVTMQRWKFASPETHRLYDRDTLLTTLSQGPFCRADIQVKQIRLPGSIDGLLATISTNRET